MAVSPNPKRTSRDLRRAAHTSLRVQLFRWNNPGRRCTPHFRPAFDDARPPAFISKRTFPAPRSTMTGPSVDQTDGSLPHEVASGPPLCSPKAKISYVNCKFQLLMRKSDDMIVHRSHEPQL
ncbi:hypothetical protein EVAR_20050_1 [Eumeta japonica]|uniref:Uncharacterized protein n=1 Tax=Eumeta variegata TaxID=151549 RepID=A0A4C1UJA4_EUMVA|nr:hypothetical protein EVAR_20050_1 [Eumeta japonica]